MTALYDLFFIDGAHKQARELPDPANDIAYAKVDGDHLIPAESEWLMSTSVEATSRINGGAVHICAHPAGCCMPAADGDIYCTDCRSRVQAQEGTGHV